LPTAYPACLPQVARTLWNRGGFYPRCRCGCMSRDASPASHCASGSCHRQGCLHCFARGCAAYL
jgi:hypothetical protein